MPPRTSVAGSRASAAWAANRYVVLIAGKGSAAGRNVLLEFKEARPSAYDVYRQRDTSPEALVARAERVVTVQRVSQAANNQYLGFAVDGPLSFQARQIGPQDARVNAKASMGAGLDGVARVQASILARAHARSAMRAVGPANPLAELADADAFAPARAGLRPRLRRRGPARLHALPRRLAPSSTVSPPGPRRNRATCSP